MPSAILPCGAVIFPCSCNNFNTMAVLLSDINKPMNMACAGGSPRKEASMDARKMVPPTWREPPMSTVFLILLRPFSENSIPITNSRKIIPVSASISTSCEALIKPSPCGPAIIPVSRNPMMAGILKRRKARMIRTERPRMITTCFRIGISTTDCFCYTASKFQAFCVWLLLKSTINSP